MKRNNAVFHRISMYFNVFPSGTGLIMRFVVISIYFNLFLCISIYSQPDSLNYYLELAAKNNPTVLQKFSEYKATLQKVPQVGSLPDPELTAGVFLSPMELVEGRQVADIRLMQMFPWVGVLKNGKDEMSLMAKGKFEEFRDAKLQAFYGVRLTWYELYKIEKDIRISQDNLQIMRTIERLTLIRYKTAPAGGGTPGTMSPGASQATRQMSVSSGSSGVQNMGGGQVSSANSSVSTPFTSIQGNSMTNSQTGTGLSDLFRIQIEITDLENEIALLKNQQSTVMARFNSLINRSPESKVAMADTLKADTLNVAIQSVADSILKNNPMLGMLKYEQQSLDSRKKMVTKMGYPMLGLGVDYALISKSGMSTSFMNGKDMVMPMVSLTIPIYRKKYKAMQSETGFLKKASEENYSVTSNNLQTESYQTIQLYEDAKRRIKLYQYQDQLARKSLDIMIKSFSVSGSGLTDILIIRQQLLDYEFKVIEAVADFNTAVAGLERLMALQ